MLNGKICDLDPVIAMLADPAIPLAEVHRGILFIQACLLKDLEARYRPAYDERPSMCLEDLIKQVVELERSVAAAEARSPKQRPESGGPRLKFTL